MGSADVETKHLCGKNVDYGAQIYKVIGLVEFSEPVDLKRYCGSKGWSAVETENSFLSGLVSAVAYGLYTPREANVVCK